MRNRPWLTVLLGLVLSLLPLVGTRPAASAAPVITDGCISSVPEPGSTEPVQICWSLFRPAGASADRPVPLIMATHGWGMSRAKDAAPHQRFLDAGYGVLTFDERGFGDSGGVSHVQNPAFEGRDVRALVEMVSHLDWVAQDAPGDPRLGFYGGSYGGGIQYLAAFEEIRATRRQVFDALAPEITWWDLNDSLAPEGVLRSEWVSLLTALSVPSQALGPEVYAAIVAAVVAGEWPDGSTPGVADIRPFFERNGPSWQVAQGRRIDVPVLIGQGTTDSLFTLEQGLTTWRRALTPRARRQGMFIGYNGGHALGSFVPAGNDVSSDPCSDRLGGGDFMALTIAFFDHALKGQPRSVKGYGRIHIATPGSTCTTVTSVRPNTSVDIADLTTTTVVGTPQVIPVVEGPIRIAGLPRLIAHVTAPTIQSRTFLGLAVGSTPENAKLVQGNVMPLDEPMPVTDVRRSVRLPGVAVDVKRGESLYLVASPIADAFVGLGSRVPGVLQLTDVTVQLPVVP